MEHLPGAKYTGPVTSVEGWRRREVGSEDPSMPWPTPTTNFYLTKTDPWVYASTRTYRTVRLIKIKETP